MLYRIALCMLLAMAPFAAADPVAVTIEDDAEADVLAVSLAGNATTPRRCDEVCPQVAAVTLFGNASSWQAVSVFGNADGGDAVSVFGNASGARPTTVFGDASGDSPLTVAGTCNERACWKVDLANDTEAERVAVSRDGDSNAQFLAVSVHGDADGDWGSATVEGENGRCGKAYVPPCWHVNGAGRGGPDQSCHAYMLLVYEQRLCVALP